MSKFYNISYSTHIRNRNSHFTLLMDNLRGSDKQFKTEQRMDGCEKTAAKERMQRCWDIKRLPEMFFIILGYTVSIIF